MRKYRLLCHVVLSVWLYPVIAQQPIYRKVPKEVQERIMAASALYENKEYERSARVYASIVRTYSVGVNFDLMLDAACAWAQADEPDSAMAYLEEVAKGGYSDYAHVMAYPDLKPLHGHPSWITVCRMIEENRNKRLKNPDLVLVRTLDTIMVRDQMIRWEMLEVSQRYGRESEQNKRIWKRMRLQDSINQILVRRVLDTRGWPGPDEVGPEGVTALFLVVQHAGLADQEKYLPLMKEAVAQHKLEQKYICYVEDRIAVLKGGRQRYGTQLDIYEGSNTYYVSPIDDPAHVDERRAAVGLQSMKQYLAMYRISWDPKDYESELPAILKDIELKKKKYGK